MDSKPFLIYSFLSPLYYENIDLYEPDDDLIHVVRRELPEDWAIHTGGFWSSCVPPGWESIEHGWKIHLSSSIERSEDTLAIAARACAEAGVSFKFCADKRMLDMSLGKNWSRFQTGKFVTAYPRDPDEFRRLIDVLHNGTRHLSGPHILTDRAYADSRTVFYRYGAHRGRYRVDPYGRKSPGYTLDDGTWIEDVRGPTFRLPPGLTDPFEAPAESDTATGERGNGNGNGPIVLRDRYQVDGVIKFNASGGISHGIDLQDGQRIVIREVRGLLGHLETEMPEDPAHILKREARLLETLTHTGLVPRYVDLFQEWEHWFLVVERLDAISLWGHSMEIYFSGEDNRSVFGLDRIVATIQSIAKGLQTIHDHGIVLRDLTKNNILFSNTDGQIKFIDLEFAYALSDTGKWLRGWTPGYASAEQAASQRPSPRDDHYAFGVLILDMLTFCAAGLDLGRDGVMAKLRLVLGDLGLPQELYTLVEGLTDRDPAARWDLARATAYLAGIRTPDAGRLMLPSREQLLRVEPVSAEARRAIAETHAGVLDFLRATCELQRRDRLWPASPELYMTNPVSMQYGAIGPAWLLLQADGAVDPRILDWIEAHARAQPLPPGLYSGLGGLVLMLLQAGRRESALALADTADMRPEAFEHSSLYYGIAGLGLIRLHLWRATGDDDHLRRAIAVGDTLLERAIRTDAGLHWIAGGTTFLGFGDGQSGIAVFLDFLAAASGESRFSEAAGLALDFDLAHALEIGGRRVWKTHVGAKAATPNLPHMRFGSAGIGSACIRHYALTGDPRYRESALDCAHTVRARISNKIWQDEGNSGYGEFMLDLSRFLDEPAFEQIAYRHAESIVVHALRRPEGIAFPGFDHFRICCDYSSGSAGIGLFLDRLLGTKARLWMLDDLLPNRGRD